MTAPPASRLGRLRGTLTAAEWRQVFVLGGVVAALHAVGFFVLLVLVAPAGQDLGTGEALGLGVGITAYTLGLRHAFDADHIAAIDNTTRKLMAEGGRPLSVGFWFSLGHATIVAALGVIVAVGVSGLSGSISDDDSAVQQATGVIGPLVSGTFLVAIGLINLVVLANVASALRRTRDGQCDAAELDAALTPRGPVSRLVARATAAVRHPWQMYPLGLLFGLGFDTATEVALLVLAGGAGAAGLPFYAILCLPVLFAAGMTLLDTVDGILMTFAYGWALARPTRRAFYNLTVTGLSVAVALLIGSTELAAVLGERLGLDGAPWSWAQAFDLNTAGYVVVSLFALTWAAALAVWRLGRLDERWDS